MHEVLAKLFTKYSLKYILPFYFPTIIGMYALLMENAGFKIEYATLFNRFMPVKGEMVLLIG